MAGSRQLIVKIVGDDKSLQAAFARSTASTKAFAANVNTNLSGGVSVGRSFDPLLARVKEGQKQADDFSRRLNALDEAAAGAGAGTQRLSDGLGSVIAKGTLVGLAITSAYTASRRLAEGLDQTGEAAFTASGKLRNFGAALLGGDVVGAFQALKATAKTLDEAGISAEEATGHYAAFKAVIASGFEGPLTAIAEQAVKLADGLRASQAAADALADSTARLGTVFRDVTGQAVLFKGAVDDIAGPRGPGGVDQINAALEQARGGQFRQAANPDNRVNANKQILARANGDLDEILRLQEKERDRLKAAVQSAIGNEKERKALQDAYVRAQADVVATGKAIKAQNDAAKQAAAAAAQQNREDTWSKIIGALDIGVSRAQLTKRLGDDLQRLEQLKTGLERQIRAGVNVEAAQTRLAQTEISIAAKQQEIRARAAEVAQARQFRALGLTATGEDIVPGVANLRKQLAQLSKRLGDSASDLPSKLAQQLRGVRKILSGELGAATKESRDKINELFKTIRGTFDQQGAAAQHTVTRAINRNAILKGLGLDAQTEAILKQRLQGFNTAGRALAPAQGTFGAFGVPFGANQQPINITTEVVLDGQKVGRSVTKHQQAAKRSNPAQKRGPHAGI